MIPDHYQPRMRPQCVGVPVCEGIFDRNNFLVVDKLLEQVQNVSETDTYYSVALYVKLLWLRLSSQSYVERLML